MAKIAVAPLVGAWIEILCRCVALESRMSLPSWERGLKCLSNPLIIFYNIVAPLVGAWIEIPFNSPVNDPVLVAPLVGAWIEIIKYLITRGCFWSLPSWERGLKLQPYASLHPRIRRSPRGSVD